MLVAATDWRRRRRTARAIIPGLLRRLQTLAQNRREGIASVLVALDSGAPATRYYALRFPVERIERHAENVADSLSTAQANKISDPSEAVRIVAYAAAWYRRTQASHAERR